MKNADKYRGPDKEWLSRMAEYEDACSSIAVGGMAVDPKFSNQEREAFEEFVKVLTEQSDGE